MEELTNPIYQKLEHQFLGWKWRAHPLALAIARVSLKTLPQRLDKFAANRDELNHKIKDVPGIEMVHNYPKSKSSELFGGICFLYDCHKLGGLNVDDFSDALNAEGVPISSKELRHLEHLRSIFTDDLPGLWGDGHPGPANIPLPKYKKGDYPVTENLVSKILQLNGWIETASGVIDQVASAIHKVIDQHQKLL